MSTLGLEPAGSSRQARHGDIPVRVPCPSRSHDPRRGADAPRVILDTMAEIPRFDPTIPVRELLARYPQIAPALAAHGVDTCCGGMHRSRTLARQKARTWRGRPRSRVRYAATEAHNLCSAMSVRELSRRFRPRAGPRDLWPRRLRRGRRPDEPIAWFATVHRFPSTSSSATCGRPRKESAPRRPRPRDPSVFSPHSSSEPSPDLTLGASTGWST